MLLYMILNATEAVHRCLLFLMVNMEKVYAIAVSFRFFVRSYAIVVFLNAENTLNRGCREKKWQENRNGIGDKKLVNIVGLLYYLQVLTKT